MSGEENDRSNRPGGGQLPIQGDPRNASQFNIQHQAAEPRRVLIREEGFRRGVRYRLQPVELEEPAKGDAKAVIIVDHRHIDFASIAHAQPSPFYRP